VVFKGETFTVDGFRLTRVPEKPVPIHIAALREGMLKVAGQVGDGVILNWLSPDDVPRSVAVVREAAKQAGRDPDAIEVTARLFVNLDPSGPESDLAVRRHIAGYLNVPVYRAFQEWLGRTEALGPMWSAWGAGDRKRAVAAVPEQVMNDLITRGSLSELKTRIQRYLDRGVDTAFLSLMTTEQDPNKKRDLMLNALRAFAPGAN
jgi:alkanesulfonate monooxygenase SsuD/methylene tetrahydromethanopterin reductase-like flavin-dependent oxidoreductase (luciferase family)